MLPAGAKPRSPLPGAVPPLTVAFCGAAYLLLAGVLFGLRRADSPRWKRSGAAGVIMTGLMALYMIRAPLSIGGVTRGWILGGAWSSMVRTAVDAIPGGTATLWLLCAASLWFAFQFAAARLARAKILPEPSRKIGF
ncbi:MAG: hypothetical protein HY822_02960 [Acidobacteria bacterium]|nr:hypothetical protein [Acidobacteriota bacterium]